MRISGCQLGVQALCLLIPCLSPRPRFSHLAVLFELSPFLSYPFLGIRYRTKGCVCLFKLAFLPFGFHCFGNTGVKPLARSVRFFFELDNALQLLLRVLGSIEGFNDSAVASYPAVTACAMIGPVLAHIPVSAQRVDVLVNLSAYLIDGNIRIRIGKCKRNRVSEAVSGCGIFCLSQQVHQHIGKRCLRLEEDTVIKRRPEDELFCENAVDFSAVLDDAPIRELHLTSAVAAPFLMKRVVAGLCRENNSAVDAVPGCAVLARSREIEVSEGTAVCCVEFEVRRLEQCA